MGNKIFQVSKSKWVEMKSGVLKREGWFIPTLRIKYKQAEGDRTNFYKDLCSKWLLENFGIDAEINEMEILEPKEIDKTLGLTGIKFSFSDGKGLIGDTVAFIDTHGTKNT